MRQTSANRRNRIRLQKIGNRLRRDAKQRKKQRNAQPRTAKSG